MQQQNNIKGRLNGGPETDFKRPGDSTIAGFLATSLTQKSQPGASKAREDSEEMRRQETRKKFKNAFQDQMITDLREGEGGQHSLLDERANFHVTKDGGLTEKFRTELRQTINEESILLEAKLQNARPADQDLFGIKRRFCEVCEEECSGYEPTKVLFGGKGEFPSFCRHCNCPAYFHKVEQEKQQIPEVLTDLITGKNIQSQDLNFNCLMAAFMIRGETNKIQTSIEIARLIQDEGIEILTSKCTYLSEEEAFFLRNRVIGQSERRLAKTLSQDFKRANFESEIKKKGEIDSLNVNALNDNNSFLMERLTQIKEFHMKRMRQSFGASAYKKGGSEQQKSRRQATSLQSQTRPLIGNLENNQNFINGGNEKFDPNESINQRDISFGAAGQGPPDKSHPGVSVLNVEDSAENTAEVLPGGELKDRKIRTELNPVEEEEKFERPKSSLKKNNSLRSASLPFDRSTGGKRNTLSKINFNMTDVFKEIQRRETIMPRPATGNFKLRYGRKTNDQKSKKFVYELHDYKKAEYLVHALETNPLLRDLCENEILIMVLNSATSQGLQQKLTGLIRASQITADEAILLYASSNKVIAMEDCIQFSPELFRLSKSIIVTEPIIPFIQLMKANIAAQGHNVFSDNLSVQSDYIREKMRTMNSGLDRSNSQRQATMRQASMRHQTSIKQTNSLNPYRQQVTSKKTQYHDLKSMTLQKKLSVLDKLNNQQARTLTILSKNADVSPIRKTVTFQREQTELKPSESLRGITLKNITLQGDEEEDVSQLDWVKRIKDKERNKKDSKLKQTHNILQFNYGVMQDFFAYSATCVQYSLQEADLSQPVCPAGIRGGKPALEWRDIKENPVNLFAVAKVGVANLIMPNTLDIKLANYQDFDSYVSLSDYFFPDSAKSQHTVLVLRPSIVKNGLNELLLKIIRANEFLVLKRKIRMLTKAEVAYLYRAEKIEERNSHLYFNMMLSGPSEVIVVSKISAVYDCNTLFNGANPYGRRRLNYLNEDQPQQIRKNVDSIGGMFEITPFTCFSEFVDLEDFLIRNSKIEKFRKANSNEQFEKTAELLYSTKLSEIRREANLLQRDFNVVGYTAKTVDDASREICIFSPSLASIQEVCLILNPIYNDQIENAMEVLVRANFVILQHEYKQLSDMQADDIFGPKYGFEEGALIIENVKTSPVHCFHLAKLAGDTEMRELFRQSDLQFEDHFCFSNWQPPFKPSQIPFLFFFMDTELTFELCMLLLYNRQTVQYTGENFLEISNTEITRIIQTCLLVTVGDKLKQLLIDNSGAVKQQSKLAGADVDKFEPLNKPPSQEKIEGTMIEGCFLEPQTLLKSNASGKKTSSVVFIAEADHHGLFELRFHRLAHVGDRENSDDFPAKQIQYDLAFDTQGHSAVIVEAMHLFERFASLSFYYNEVNKLSYNVCPAFYKFKIQPFEYLFDHANMDLIDDNSSLVTDEMLNSSQSDMYSVREHKVQPEEQLHTAQARKRTSLYSDDVDKNNRVEDQRKQRREVKEWRNMQTARRINRVYEVEEHMGSEFLEELARLHQEHLNILRHNITFTLDLSKNQEQQKSLPAYIYGLKLAQMVKQLELVKCFGKDQLRGAGKIRYNRETKVLQGELPRVTQSSYFDFDRKRYLTMLENFRGGWGYYLSVLEIEIIESKLMFILDSLTFKYTRQPQFLIVVPDRLTSTNLRISEKIKILNPHATEDFTTKFFKPLSEDLIDPNRELDVRNHVDSVLQTLNHSMLQKSLDAKLKLEGTSIQQILDQQEKDKKKEYSIHKDCALVGFDAIARRPKHHLIASVLWLLDFNLRKVNRKSEFFIGDRNRKIDQIRVAVEEEYDEVLDILKSSILANYCDKSGEPEINAALDIVDLKEGGYETEFERHMRKKNLQEELKLKQIQEQIEDEKRRRRSTMSLEELITTEVHQPAEEFKKQQRKELEEFLNMRAGLDKDGTEFMQMLERSKMHFGPYAIQLAEEYFKKQMKMFMAKIDPRTQEEQEKISFVKMEYFLYGVAEADRLIQQLKSMEARINKLAEDADNKTQEADDLKLQVNNFHRVPIQLDVESRVRELRLRKSQKKAEEAALKAEQDLKEQRHEISAKECELLMVFRELMSYDFYVPDLFFDREMLTRKKENKVVAEKFIMPLKTFWRPIELDEYYEHDLNDKRYMKKVNPSEDIEQKIGQYLAKPLRETILRQDQDRIARLREGGEETQLYMAENVKRKENLIFDKYMSHGQRRQDAALFEAKKIIDHKTSKKPFEADIPFHFSNTTK